MLFLNFFILVKFLVEKNLLIDLTPIFFAYSCTFFDGSNPIASISEFLKFFKNVPSFDPSSIILELKLSYFLIHEEYFLKCSIINFELEV